MTRIVATADAEAALGDTRLNGELTRSVFQLRLFGEALREGSYLVAAIDHAGPTPLGPGPDVCRMRVPIGPVAVFGASSFPFAFFVPGGDTASALAAGCPVVLKGHDSHVLTSQLTFDVMRAQHHGGPWPATNSQHTSVGVTALRRFLRPVAWQDAPQSVLPDELRDGDAGIPRRIDGVLQLPA